MQGINRPTELGGVSIFIAPNRPIRPAQIQPGSETVEVMGVVPMLFCAMEEFKLKSAGKTIL